MAIIILIIYYVNYLCAITIPLETIKIIVKTNQITIVNTKVDLRFDLGKAYWIPEYARKRIETLVLIISIN